jgi:hypothetical protein
MKKFKLIIASLIAFLSILLNIYQMNENPKTNPVDTVKVDSVIVDSVSVDSVKVDVFDIVSDVTN